MPVFERLPAVVSRNAKALGDERWIGYAYLNWGELEQEQGNPREASRLYDASLKLMTALGEDWGIAYALEGLGRCAFELGDAAGARRHIERALASISRARSSMPVKTSAA